MRMLKAGMAAALAAAGCLSATTGAQAAQVFNYTNVPIVGFAWIDGLASQYPYFDGPLPPGQASGNIQEEGVRPHTWQILARQGVLCGQANVTPILRGANYLVVSQAGTQVACTLCSGAGQVQFRLVSSIQLPTAYTSPKQGC